ncbi:hypothetical protein [Streptomyces sp. NPDC059909]|uniref:hypothetical protein n=1 Tax=Streptomyces sp. NPDC059909 TaxID=3346998 RepID=UPI00364D710E
MARTSRTQRFVMLTASTALAAGGALLPSGAFAAPAAAPQAGTVTTVVSHHEGHGHHDRDEGKKSKLKIVFKKGKTKLVVVLKKHN